jgi:hypothetical protein
MNIKKMHRFGILGYVAIVMVASHTAAKCFMEKNDAIYYVTAGVVPFWLFLPNS